MKEEVTVMRDHYKCEKCGRLVKKNRRANHEGRRCAEIVKANEKLDVH